MYSLDQLRNDVEKKYQDFSIEIGPDHVVRFRSPMRLKKDERTELKNLFKMYQEFQDNTDDDSALDNADMMQEMLRDQLRLVAENKKSVEELLEAIGDDLAMLSELLEQYNEATQVGEA